MDAFREAFIALAALAQRAAGSPDETIDSYLEGWCIHFQSGGPTRIKWYAEQVERALASITAHARAL